MSTRIKGGITAPKGFLAAGIHAGIKKTPQLDLALIVSETPGPIAGVFTSNTLPAAPVILDRLHVKKGLGQAMIINSGNANAFTGAEGLAHAKEMGQRVAEHLRIPLHQVFIGSTGVIGVPLPMPALRKGIARLVARVRKAGDKEAARAIMTTPAQSHRHTTPDCRENGDDWRDSQRFRNDPPGYGDNVGLSHHRCEH